MKSGIRYILPLLLVALLSTACMDRNGKKIPRADLARIYADLFLADQWIYDHELKYQTDTVAVYEPIFEKYGYTTRDFRYSIECYMDDAEDFQEIIGQSKFLLQCRLKDIGRRKAENSRLDSIRVAREKNAVDFDLLQKEGLQRDRMVGKFFPMLPVDEIHVARPKFKFHGPIVDTVRELHTDKKFATRMPVTGFYLKREELIEKLINR